MRVAAVAVSVAALLVAAAVVATRRGGAPAELAGSGSAAASRRITIRRAGGWNIGDRAPAFRVRTSNGDRFALPAGTPAVLVFVTAWCDPAMELSALARLDRQLGPRVAIVGISPDPTEPLTQLTEYADRLGGIDYGFVQDGDGSLTRSLRVTSVDTTVVVNAAGRIVYRDAIPTNQTVLRSALDKAGVR